MRNLLILATVVFFSTQLKAQDATPALFPGGESAWQHYLDTAFNVKLMNAQMTQKDKERFGSTQKVTYSFNVLADGSIGLINIEGPASQPVRNEIQRVLKSCPRWTPATLGGKVSTYRKRQVSTFAFE